MDDQAILDIIRSHATEGAAALRAVQSGDRPLTVPVINVLARREHRDPAVFWLEQLQERGLVTAFVEALRARGVSLADDVLDDPDGVIPTDRLQRFLAQAQAFRCRIVKNGAVAGSGVLVGPSLVLTSWHVIAVDGPGRPQEPAPNLEVLLADNMKFEAKLPAAFQSECGDAEYRRRAPVHDSEVADRHDVALLELVHPAATHLGHVSLASPPPPPRPKGRVVLVHSPGGSDQVIDFGFAGKIKNVTARWRHDVPTAGGSSGGACFNKDLQFLGVHQAQFDTGARFVPIERFIDSILERVRADVAPRTLWSLDGTTSGRLVIGRGRFFQAIAAAGDEGSRVRGVRVKRAAIGLASTGLAFSLDILEQLLVRRGPEHRLVRITMDQVVDDLVTDIRRRVRLGGLDLPEAPAGHAGVAPGQAPPATTIRDRAEQLASAIETAAVRLGTTVWLFIDNPTVSLTEDARLTLESFVGAALTRAHLRLVVAGLETVTLPGLEFTDPPASEVDRAPGLMVEYLGEFRRSDVLDLLTVASRELTGAVNDMALAWATDRALLDLDNVNGLYDPAQLATVAERLRDDLALIAGGAR